MGVVIGMVGVVAGERNESEGRPREIVATMPLCRFCVANDIPSERCSHMHSSTEKEDTHGSWYKVSKHKLDRMSILSCNTYGHLVLVVDFVDVWVKSGMVQQSMAHMEGHIFHEHAEK